MFLSPYLDHQCVKLSEWARRNGAHYQTAWKWARDETMPCHAMPVPVVKTVTGRYLVLEQLADKDGRAATYCRVSSAGQKADLERQAGRVVTEVGSGLNGRRPKLARFGLEHLSAASS